MPRYTSEHPASAWITVYVDGNRIHSCVEADTDAGYALMYDGSTDENGTWKPKTFYMDGVFHVCPPIRINGKVEVKLSEHAPVYMTL